MASLVIPSELQRFTDGAASIEVAAGSYRELLAELRERFPALPEDRLRKQAIAIDGRVVHEPLLEKFGPDSELVLIAKIAGG